MIKFFKTLIVVSCVVCSITAYSQTTINSPYSRYGLGNIRGSILPQFRAMGGIGVGVRNLVSVYNNINPANPASYSNIRLTTFDIGAYSDITRLSKSNNTTGKSFNATLSHVLFAVPLNQKSAFSFGLVPFSDLGYQFKLSGQVPSDTTNVDYIYGGDGGLSKAYLGYAVQIGKHLSVGLNTGYLFGKLNNNSSTEFPDEPVALNSRVQKSTSLRGFTFDLGAQYFTNLSPKVGLTIGYLITPGTKINSNSDIIATHYQKDFENGDESTAVDTVINAVGVKVKNAMPLSHTIGISFSGVNKWLIGADYSMSNWSDYREGTSNPNLQNSNRLSVGAQLTPNINSLTHYFSLVDYRVGFKHEKTYININNTDIKQTSLSFGLGLPLISNRSTFYKINFSAEVGQRGTLSNNLVRERFVNFNVGFLLNDKWFYRTKLD